MQTKHNFVQLAEVQRAQKTLYCGGLDPHSFGDKNKEVYSLGEIGNETRILQDVGEYVRFVWR